MKHAADTVVIGGGVVGCSIAYQLAKSGQRNVVIVEKSQVASGASGRCPGGFRHQWATEADIRLMTASITMLTGLREDLDSPQDLEIRQYGYLLLAETEDEMEQFRKNVALQRSLGIPVEMLNPQQVTEVAPGLNTDDILGATFCRWDGRASPYLITHAYAAAAKRLGVEINVGTTVTGLRTDGEKIAAVITDHGVIETRQVVCVAGTASRRIAQMVGADVPITPARRQMLIPAAIKQPIWPAILSHHVVFFQTPRGDAVYAGGSSGPEDMTESDANTRAPYLSTIQAMSRLMPRYNPVKVVRLWAGTYDMSPDAHPIVGPLPGVEGFYMAAGFSGHGFMMAPVVGKVMAEMLIGQQPFVDISDLQAERFQRGGHEAEVMVY